MIDSRARALAIPPLPMRSKYGTVDEFSHTAFGFDDERSWSVMPSPSRPPNASYDDLLGAFPAGPTREIALSRVRFCFYPEILGDPPCAVKRTDNETWVFFASRRDHDRLR